MSASFAQWGIYTDVQCVIPSPYLLDSIWYIATCLSVPRVLIDAAVSRGCVGTRWHDGGEVDRLSGCDRGNEIIAELLPVRPPSSIHCFICVCFVCVCVCMHVCLALFSAKIYIKIALHLTSTLLNEAHESGGRHVVWHGQLGMHSVGMGGVWLVLSLGLLTALL